MTQSSHQLDHTGRYITGIDGLRALAVLAIILFHLNPAFAPGGFAGVDIFFVCSGFVVARASQSYVSGSYLGFLGQFYTRRLLRIYPALLFVVLSSMVFLTLVLPSVPDTNYILPTGVAALAGASNILLYYISGDYFSDIAQYNFFTHTWSLGVEEQFYFIFPFVYFLIMSPWRRRSIYGVLILLLGIMLSFVALWLAGNGPFGFYMIFTRFWELGLGVLVHVFLARIERALGRSDHFAPLLAMLGTVLIAASLVFLRQELFPFPTALFPCLGTAILIALLASQRAGFVGKILSLPALTWIGRISYSLYLWHWVVIVAIRWFGPADPFLSLLLAMVTTFGLSWLTYRLVEIPFRRRGTTASQHPRLFFPAFAAASVVAFVLAGSLTVLAPRIGLSATNEQAIWRTTAVPPRDVGDVRTVASTDWRHGGRFISFCAEACPLQEKKPVLYIVGDSHAGAYFRLAYRLSSRYGVQSLLITKGGCPLVSFNPEGQGAGCNAFLQETMRELEQRAGPGDTIFLSALYLPRYRGAFQDNPENSPAVTVDAGQLDTQRKILDMLLRTGARVAMEAPKPLLKTAPFRCADAWTSSSAYCQDKPGDYRKADLETMRQPVLTAMRNLLQGNENAVLWDPFPFLCDGEECGAWHDGHPVFYDTDHLSGFGNDMLVAPFAKDVLRLFPGVQN